MIHSLTISDIKKTKFDYLKPNSLLLKKPIEFKKGLNIVIGENGSGKTTLIKMLTEYTFCWSGRTNLALGIENKDTVQNLFDREHNLYSGIIIKNDYRFKVFKTIQNSDIKSHEQFDNIDFFKRTYVKTKQSDGENQLYAISTTIKEMFSTEISTNYNILDDDGINDLWKNYCVGIKQYIDENKVEETKENYAITLLMDEPDRNLDINNVKQIHTILSNPKDNGQIIVTLHNPLLIYSLLKMKDINIIELSKGYKDKIVKTINEIL